MSHRRDSDLARAFVECLDDDALNSLAERLRPLLGSAAPGELRAVYTVATLAAELEVSPKTIRGAIRRGELRATKRGERWLVAADTPRGPAPNLGGSMHPQRTQQSTTVPRRYCEVQR
jgi:excisionase family DNA binding protein